MQVVLSLCMSFHGNCFVRELICYDASPPVQNDSHLYAVKHSDSRLPAACPCKISASCIVKTKEVPADTYCQHIHSWGSRRCIGREEWMLSSGSNQGYVRAQYRQQ